ncbi:MAG: hypothetical protein ACT4QD_25210 [Acidobacteriota bacterium]
MQGRRRTGPRTGLTPRGCRVALMATLAHAWPALGVATTPILRSADLVVTFGSSERCAVVMTVQVDGADRVEHRLLMPDGVHVDRIAIAGAAEVEPARDIGRTRALALRPQQPVYELRYEVEQLPSLDGRCPVWLPAVPADGVSRAVRLQIDLPPASLPGSSLPTVAWSGTRGTAMLGHVPAFVRVDFSPAGAPRPWNVARTVDFVTIVAFTVGSLAWLWRRRHGTGRLG